MSGATGASGQIALLATDVASLTVATNALEAGYTTLLNQVANSSSLSPADQASLTDSINKIVADAAAATAAVSGATGSTGATGATGSTHTPQDTADLTANGSPRADGSIRNNFFLPGFNGANPETT